MSATLSVIVFLSASPLLLVLVLACAGVVIAVPYAASQGRLHIPGYAGLALASFAVAFILGRISGHNGVRGTHAGMFLAIACFLLAAVAVGSVLAIFFHRERPQE